MFTVTFYTEGDIVEIREDWRDWKKGEIARVIKYGFERNDPTSLQWLELESLNPLAKHDVNILYGYNVVLSSKLFSHSGYPILRNGLLNTEQDVQEYDANTLNQGSEPMAQNKSGQQLTEWISVKDENPGLRQPVLVYNTEGATLIAQRYSNGWVAFFKDGEAMMGELSPTHWQPLPNPPKEKIGESTINNQQ